MLKTSRQKLIGHGGKFVKKKLVQFAILTALGVTTLVSPVTAYASVDSNIEAAEEKLSELQSKEQTAQSVLAEITQSIQENETKAGSLMEEMEAAQNTLKELQVKIETLTAAIEQRQEKLAAQARSVQLKGNTNNFVQFLLDAETLADAMGRMDVISQLVKANQDLVSAQKEDIEAVATAEAETEAKLQEQNLLAAELEAAKTTLETQKLEKEIAVATIAAEKATAKEDKERYLSMKEAAEVQTAALTSVEVEPVATISASADSNTQATTEAPQTVTVKASTSTSQPAPAAKASGSLLDIAYSVSGTPYLYGGTTTAGFDCSGFTSYVFAKAGMSLPRTAAGQYSASTKISQSQAQPGDLVFFNQTGSIDHVGIYLGNNKFIGAQSSTGVAVAEINQYYWAKYLVGFGRVN